MEKCTDRCALLATAWTLLLSVTWSAPCTAKKTPNSLHLRQQSQTANQTMTATCSSDKPNCLTSFQLHTKTNSSPKPMVQGSSRLHRPDRCWYRVCPCIL